MQECSKCECAQKNRILVNIYICEADFQILSYASIWVIVWTWKS